MKYTKYIGILLGAIYGIAYRILCENEAIAYIADFSIQSISFVWILPITIGIIPILFAKNEIIQSKRSQFFYPFWAVLLFFVFALSSGLEDFVCILIIALPYTIVAGITGLFFGWIIKKYFSNALFSLVFLPILFAPIEAQFSNKKENFIVSSTIIIDAPKTLIWPNIIEVPTITKDEYTPGFFNAIGIPRPVKSELKVINNKIFRIGHFSDELRLYESITAIDSLNFVQFNVHIEESKLRDTPTDRHLLQSPYFKFENITYQLHTIDNGSTAINLSCEYTMESKMNGYANFWAEQIVKDFEQRLLNALKIKFEK